MPRGRTVTPLSQAVDCDVCGRRLLPGEQVYELWERDERRLACELCLERAFQLGWRDHEEVPPRRELGRGRRRLRLPFLQGRANGAGRRTVPAQGEVVQADGWDPVDGKVVEEQPTEEVAVPGVEAALALFNQSDGLGRLVAIARSLGEPVLTVFPLDRGSYGLTAVWEICWYRYRIDLQAASLEAELLASGDDPAQLPEGELAGNCRLERSRGVVLADGGR